jgi:tetratricopeptide (TPR) repeat protein
MMLGLAYGAGGAFDKSETAFRKAIQLGGAAAAEAHFYLAALYNKQDRYADARQEMEVYLKEARNLKDPAQVKAMIEKLREKEKIAASRPKPIEPAPAADNSLSSANQGTKAVGGPAEAKTDNTVAVNKPPITVAVPALSPEMKELLHLSELNGGTMSRKLLDFTYTLKKTRRILNDRGNSSAAQVHVYEAYPIKGEHVLILLSRDGIPSKTVANDRGRAAKELMEAERRKEKTARPAGDSTEEPGDYVSAGVFGIQGGKPAHISINVSAFLRHCEFFSPRVETFDDRPAVALNFRPRFGVELPRNYSYINKMVGTVWIDREDRIVVRLEGWPDAEGAFDFAQSIAPRDEASLIYQQERLAGGLWFPRMIRMNAEGRSELFGGLNWDVVFEFGNYRQFNTQADDLKIKDPARNP